MPSSFYPAVKRTTDILITLLIILAVLPVTIVVGVAVRVTSQGPALYWSKRVGANNRLFAMPKFRTMHVGTPAVARHLPSNARATLTPIGGFLRSSSLDEIPQLWSVFKGEMSLVGPRPALFNQHDLILLRDASGVSGLTLGITGWAQVNGRDELGIPAKVSVEVEYLRLQGVFMDIRILFLTAIRVIRRQNIQH